MGELVGVEASAVELAMVVSTCRMREKQGDINA